MNYSAATFSISKKCPIAHEEFKGKTFSLGLQYISDETLALPEPCIHIPWGGGGISLNENPFTTTVLEELAALRVIHRHSDMAFQEIFMYLSKEWDHVGYAAPKGTFGKKIIYCSHDFGEQTANAIIAITDCLEQLFYLAEYKSEKARKERCASVVSHLTTFTNRCGGKEHCMEHLDVLLRILWALFYRLVIDGDETASYFSDYVIKTYEVSEDTIFNEMQYIYNATQVFNQGEVLEEDKSIAFNNKKHKDFYDLIVPVDYPYNLRIFPYDIAGLTRIGNIIIQNIDDTEYCEAARTALQYVELSKFAEAMIPELKSQPHSFNKTSFRFASVTANAHTGLYSELVAKKELSYLCVDLNAIS